MITTITNNENIATDFLLGPSALKLNSDLRTNNLSTDNSQNILTPLRGGNGRSPIQSTKPYCYIDDKGYLATNEPIILQSGMNIDLDQGDGEALNAGTTHFVDSAPVTTVVKSKATVLADKDISSIVSKNNSVHRFFSQPVVFEDDSIALTDTGVLFHRPIDQYIYNPTRPLWRDKLKGYYGVRYTSVFTLKINASRYDIGRIGLAFLPSGGANLGADTTYILHTHMRMASLPQLTTLTHVDFDVNSDTSVTLKIPWTSAYPFQKCEDYALDRGSPGNLVLYVYSPYVGATSTLTYTIFQHLEDVETFGVAIPQSGFSIRDDWQPVFQAGSTSKRTKKDPLTTEEEANRPISGGFRLLADVASGLSTVPLLSTFTTPVSWVADAISRAAYIWGYSAPKLVAPPQWFTSSGNPNIGTFNKTVPTQSLALSLNNKVSQDVKFSGSDYDEMSLDYIKSIYGHFDSDNMLVTYVDELAFYHRQLVVRDFSLSTAQTHHDTVFHTTTSFLGNMYQYFRGSLNIKIILVKTEFTIGRVAVVFNPLGPAAASAYDDTDYIYREIIDFRSGTEFIVNLPFISDLNWIRTSDIFGSLTIYKIDDLKVASGAPTTVPFLLEVCCGDDAQFAVRSGRVLAPVTAPIFQSGSGDWKDPIIVDKPIGGSELVSKNYSHTGNCMGEPNESLLQLLKAGSTNNAATINDDFTVFPYSLGVSSGSGAVFDPPVDLYTTITSCYGLQRGGVRITFLGKLDRVMELSWYPRASTFQAIVGTLYDAATSLSGNFCGFVVSAANQALTAVDVPPYLQVPAAATITDTTLTAIRSSDRPFQALGHDGAIFQSRYLGGSSLRVHRAVADDFTLGLFINIPPMYLLTGSV